MIVAVFVLFSWQTNARLTRSVVENMESSQLRFAGIDARLRREHTLQAMALAENPTLKAAVDTYYAERGNGHELGQLQSTIETELTKLQADHGRPRTLGDRCSRHRPGERWSQQGRLAGRRPSALQRRRERRAGRDRRPAQWAPICATAVPLVLGRDVVGEFFLASPLDDAYAVDLASEARADIAILLDGRVIASSTPP